MAQPATQWLLYEVPGSITRTKITPPRPSTISRPDLVQRLDAGAGARLTLIIAPAGWGKSSVLAEWASRSSVDVAWLCCDEADNNPTRFLRALVTAVDRVRPGVGGDLFAMLRSSQPLPADQLLAALAEAIAENPEPLTIVLDDFHLVEHPELLSSLEDLVATAPANLRVMVASRASPQWSLARWRAYGDVTEVGTAELAFTEAEIAAMIGNDRVDGEAIRELRERSEGWVAGIRLAVLWLQRSGNAEDLGTCFQGTHRDIADYLAEEVFNRLSDDVRRFLLDTSVLDQFSALLADAVTGLTGAAAVVEQLEAQGLFLLPMDHERRWYRYHGIFREFLRGRLREEAPDREIDLHRRAAAWYRDHGDAVAAADYLLRIGDAGAAAALVDEIAERLLLQQGETHTLIRLVEQMPREAIRPWPALQRFFAWGLVLTGRLDEAETLARSFEADVATGDPALANTRRSEIAGIRSRIAAYRGDHEETIAQATRALALVDDALDWFRADAYLSLGFAYRSLGKIEQAAEVFARASQLGWRCNIPHAACWGSRYQALTYVSQGRLQDATILIEEEIERARSGGLDRTPAFAALLIGRGELRYERNDLVGARRDLGQAHALAQQVGDAKILMNVYVALALLDAAEGRADEARASARRAINVFNGPMERATEAWLALKRGDLPAVRRWIEWYRANEGDTPSLARGETEQVMFGRALLATGQTVEATRFLSELLRQAEDTGRWGRAIVIRMILAVQADAGGDDAAAFAHLRTVLDLAVREHYVRTVLDEGPDLLRLLRRAARHDDVAARRQYAATLLAAGDAQAAPARAPGAEALIEPLTDRQMEILRLMVDGQSNREIAEALYVAEGTVKAHLHQIYGKLMVRNRAEAIRAARELRVLT